MSSDVDRSEHPRSIERNANDEGSTYIVVFFFFIHLNSSGKILQEFVSVNIIEIETTESPILMHGLNVIGLYREFFF